MKNSNQSDQIKILEAKIDRLQRSITKLEKKLTDLLVSEICPVGKEIAKLMSDKEYLEKILKKGSEKANIKAEENLKNIREKIGFI